MSKRAYLTIDDSPTNHTDAMTDWLASNGIPAVIFAIGSRYEDMHLKCEGMEQNPGPIERAIEKGFVIGNHTYTHRRSSTMSFDEICDEIEKTERLIEGLYKKTGRTRLHKMIRFPHIDRGCGGYVVDYDAAERLGYDLKPLFLDGLNITLLRPTEEQIEKKARVQAYLAQEGYTAAPFAGVTFDWYQKTEMAEARDSLYTFSTSDWMMNPDFEAYRGAWPYRSMAALKSKIDSDAALNDRFSANIILAHDHNNMLEVSLELFEYMKNKGIEFLEV